MFCAFEGPPKILRIHGSGEAVLPTDNRFPGLLGEFLPLEPPLLASVRTVIHIAVERIADSCGYGVPLMRYEGERSQLADWTDNRLRKEGSDAIARYQAEKNSSSIDGLPALAVSPREASVVD
jgi:hypothetical protein